MIRFTYLIPRLIILALIFAAVWASADPLARYVVVNRLERSVGAKVEIGQVRYSPSKQKLYLKEFAIADPKRPMTNLIQADMAYLNLGKRSLLNRNIVIETGQTSNVVFGAPRTESGQLLGKQPAGTTPIGKPWTPIPFENGNQISQNWVDQLQPSAADDPTTIELDIVDSANLMAQGWQATLEQISKNIQSLKKATQLARDEAKKSNGGMGEGFPGNNPLRNTLVISISDLEVIQHQSKLIAEQILEFERKVIDDREALRKTHASDIEKLKELDYVSSFDADSVSELLLSEMHHEFSGEILGWFHWFQSALPDPKTDLTDKSKRGIDIVFEGTTPKPDFLIKSIDMEGEGWLATKHIRFAGTAYNLTPQPERHDEPASFDLRAQGDEHVLVSCVLDRRNERPIDTLGIVCPDLELPSRLLGNEKSLLVTLGSESHLQADIKIQLIENEVRGEVIFRHSNVSLHVDKIHDLAGGKNTALQMNQGLAAVRQFESKITVSGTMDDYQLEFSSNLGKQFAKAVDGLLNQKNNLAISRQKQLSDKVLTAHLAHIKDNVLPSIEKLSRSLEAETIELAKYAPPKPAATPQDGNKLR